MALLDRLGVDPAGNAAVIASRPDPAVYPEMRWVADRVYQDLIAKLGWTIAEDGFMGWPDPPDSDHPVGRHLYVWVFLAAFPAVRRSHKDRGISEDVSWDTSQSLGHDLFQRWQVYGIRGLTSTWTLPRPHWSAEVSADLRKAEKFDVPVAVDRPGRTQH